MNGELEKELTILFYLELEELFQICGRYYNVYIPLKEKESKKENAIQLYEPKVS